MTTSPNSGLSALERLAAVQAVSILKFSLGVVYLHFGFLKFYPDLSPAELLATQTIMALTDYRLDAQQSLFLLAVFETVIGLGFLFGVMKRTVFALFTLHMLGTLTPLILLPEFAFKIAPLAPTLEGQYIIKNIVFMAAGWTILLPDALRRPVGATLPLVDPADAIYVGSGATVPAAGGLRADGIRLATAPHLQITKEHQFCE